MTGGRNFGPLWAIQVPSVGLGHFVAQNDPKWPKQLKWPKLAQSFQEWPKMAQTLRENLDGPKWPKIPASHHSPQNFKSTFSCCWISWKYGGDDHHNIPSRCANMLYKHNVQVSCFLHFFLCSVPIDDCFKKPMRWQRQTRQVCCTGRSRIILCVLYLLLFSHSQPGLRWFEENF